MMETSAFRNRYTGEWAQTSLCSEIPAKIPMGESLKVGWSPTGVKSTAPVRVRLAENVEITIAWQEYRWVLEKEYLGQFFHEGNLIYLTEKRCCARSDAGRPYDLYQREDQKSVVVTHLLAALQNTKGAEMSVSQHTDEQFEIQFVVEGWACALIINVAEKKGILFESETGDFPDGITNEHTAGLIPTPTQAELQRQAAKAQDPSQCQEPQSAAFATSQAMDGTVTLVTRIGGRIPPFDASGLIRVDKRNHYIKAPFKDHVHTVQTAAGAMKEQIGSTTFQANPTGKDMSAKPGTLKSVIS